MSSRIPCPVGEYVGSFTHSKTKSCFQNCHSTLKKRQYCGIGVHFGKQKLCSKHAMVMSNMQCVTQRLTTLLLTICSELAGKNERESHHEFATSRLTREPSTV
ncbi:hypothetical protein CY35_08G041200 [Sphagnum magellanicum]|nr:hypothetical protein CY35_08G041200 [Sphagnum magellanicum]